MLPPKHVYSAIVKNTGKTDVTVTATYEMPEGKEDITVIAIKAGEQGTLGEKIVTTGTYQQIGNIKNLHLKSACGKESTISSPYNVNSPTKNHVFTIADDLSIKN
eukprot:Tbor_TRINITY_DN5589_c1_g1::TRINITY_DN5589_c1_g1_i1::g.12995::m.12995